MVSGVIQGRYAQAREVSKKTRGNKLSVVSEVNNGATSKAGTAVGEEHHLPLAYTTVWFLEEASSLREQCSQWPISASWCFAAPALDREVSGRGKESWLFPGTMSHWIAHLPFQSFMLHIAFSKRKNMSY